MDATEVVECCQDTKDDVTVRQIEQKWRRTRNWGNNRAISLRIAVERFHIFLK